MGFKPLKEKVKITIGKNENSSDSYEDGDTTGDNYVLRWFEEQLNIDYEYAWTAAGDAYNQKSALVISHGRSAGCDDGNGNPDETAGKGRLDRRSDRGL